MKKQNSTAKLKSFFGKNWFRMLLLGLVLYAFFEKDFSFQLNMQTPLKTEEKTSPDTHKPERAAQKERKKYSDKGALNSSVGNNTTRFDRFPTSFIGEERKPLNSLEELAKIDEQTKLAFLKRFSQVAISERKKFGIPSSIILANGLFQSFAGKRDISQKGNNFFALPCTTDWQGKSETVSGKCYRNYENAWLSFRDHSKYITNGKFEELRSLSPTDFEAWARALEKVGFSEQPALANHLIQIIGQYHLQELDFK